VQFLPARRSNAMPRVGTGTRFLLAQPFLAETARMLLERGATWIPGPFPLGADGTLLWLRAAAEAFGIDASHFARVCERPYERAYRSLTRYRESLAGKRIFFFPDSQLELPLARFVSRELGMSLVEVGTPYLHRTSLAVELAQLPPETVIVEGQDLERQLSRCYAAAPDLVVCGLGLANPLEAKGIATKWSIELVFTPVQGFDQAADLAELFWRPLDRRARLVA
jgi:light-independent protochlorophyllide reductase subunit N